MDQKNIVWITLESLRYDHTSLSSYPRETTPRFREIAEAENGRSFDLSFSHGIWTLSSSASILTGTYPSSHGTGMVRNTLSKEVPTVAERVSTEGYQTVCLSPTPYVGPETGLDRGFDEFVHEIPSNWPAVCGYRSLAKYFLSFRRHGGGLTTNGTYHPQSYILSEGIKRRLSRLESGSSPVFLYAHYGDTHHPYTPSLSYLNRFHHPLSTKRARELVLELNTNLIEKIASDRPFTEEEWRTLLAMYDATIAYVDSQIGAVYDAVRNRDDTILVVTGDHGELFGEEGLLAHKITTHDAVCHVPLLVYGPSELTDHDHEIVQPLDVSRTLLEENGVATDGMAGIDLRSDQREHAIIQRGWKRTQMNLEKIAEHTVDSSIPETPHGDLTTLRTTDFKFEYADNHSALFVPPDEQTVRTDRFPDIAGDFQQTVRTFLETQGKPRFHEESEKEFSDSAKDRLRNLGYIVD